MNEVYLILEKIDDEFLHHDESGVFETIDEAEEFMNRWQRVNGGEYIIRRYVFDES